ncbi:TlpA family protein disulfide reductase [Streptomyces sp. RB6PN25]|uniref:TlpA family protein disulfide reductase n=1 Tax=Streptomyces humicola TaxID=2953240 RepID=A0ABT1PVR6_9ACTN|nr:TlpA disulfide reductase family protein [Streptomyces humicola]MCQ4081233.1 TlpA family protein disulfide reductase [Streptomyces humicola]
MSLTRAPLPRPRRRAAAALAAAASLALALSGCGSLSGSGSSPSGTADTKFVQGTGVITTAPKGQRPTAPDISGKTVDGKQLSLSDFKGKVVVLNVWGSWCDPCRAEAPNLAAVAKATQSQGVQFVGINTRDYSPAQAQSFERSFGITYPSFFDPNGTLLLKFPQGSLPPQAIPTTLIIDRQGKIAVRALTALTQDQLTKALDPIIAEK